MINLHVNTSKQKEIADALKAFLKDAGLEVTEHPAGDHMVFIASDTLTPAVTPDPVVSMTPPAEIPVPVPTEIPGTVVPVEIPMGTIGGSENEITVALSPSDVVAAGAEPEQIAQATPSASGDLTLKNLSTVCTIPFCTDTSLPCSLLKVQRLTNLGDQVSFSYCSMSFKFPIEKPEAQSVICNSNPHFTDTSIRAIACIAGKDDIPVLLKLEDGEECCVVFGQDVADVLSHSQEEIENGTLSAQ